MDFVTYLTNHTNICFSIRKIVYDGFSLMRIMQYSHFVDNFNGNNNNNNNNN